MKILLVTPAPPRSKRGNRITAERWAGMLRALGSTVTITESFQSQACEMMVALHAKHSAPSIARYREIRPHGPLVLAMTGTDLYRDIHRFATARRSMQLADRLVLLQPHGAVQLPKSLHAKVRVIYQSVVSPGKLPKPLAGAFEVIVAGHLRSVKDPFRTALAARNLPEDSRIRITHLGQALSPTMEDRAIQEMKRNDRYHWLNEKSRIQSLRLIARSRLLVVTSKMEGGANVVSEAIVMGTPVISSRISGSIGLLGEQYPGYFDYGSTEQLTQLLHRSETDARFYRSLVRHCDKRRPLFDPKHEQLAWRDLIAEFDLP